MQPKISVIVPVYKAEKYLCRCVDSILAQTYTDFELILVDDGSPDNSGVICDEYANKDSRIIVIHKENGGVASARQCGIDNATGIYTIHVDPDDWVDPNMLEELYNKAIQEKADMVICDYWFETKDNCSLCKQEPTNTTPQNIIRELLLDKLHGSLCNKLIKRSFYTNNNVAFAKGINTNEDFLVCIKILINEPVITYINRAYYHYDQYSNSGSITRNFDLKTYQMLQTITHELQHILGVEYTSELNYKKAQIASLCIRTGVLTSKEFKSIYKKQYKDLAPCFDTNYMKILFRMAANGFLYIITTILKIKRTFK